MKLRRIRNGYLFVSIWIIGFAVFTLWPLGYSLYLSMCSVRVGTGTIHTTFMGLQNYVDAFRTDVNFITYLLPKLEELVVYTPMIVVFSLICALLLNKQFRGRTVFRAIFFMPVVMIGGPVISTLIANKAQEVIEPNKYMIYRFFTELPDSISIVGQPFLYIFDNLELILWYSGVQIILFIASLQKIDSTILEAARIDGASGWEIFWKITLPSLRSMAMITAIYSIVTLAQQDSELNTYIMTYMFNSEKVYSYSAAMAWIYLLIQLMLIGLVFLILRERRDKPAAM